MTDPAPTQASTYDAQELLRRAMKHPVAGPILEIIARDLVIEDLRRQLAPPAEEPAPAPARKARGGRGPNPPNAKKEQQP